MKIMEQIAGQMFGLILKIQKKPDGKLKIWIDGKLAYDYEGPTNWGKKKHKGNPKGSGRHGLRCVSNSLNA